jgi:uncharacterized protein
MNSSYSPLRPLSRHDKSNLCALAVMIKAPVPKLSKTRLTPPLSPAEAAMLSACFLRDTAANLAAVSIGTKTDCIAVYTPVGLESAFEDLLPTTFTLLAQRGKSFGERLYNAAEDLFSMGYTSICLIDSDSPTLPPALLRAAISSLERLEDRVVLGAASDGGYYLIGLKKAHGHLFSGIDWSTSRVLTQTMERAAEIKLETEILPFWYDVDDPATLRQLCNELFSRNGKHRAQSDAVAYDAPATRSYLSRLIATNGGRHRIWTSSRQNSKRLSPK